MAGGVSNGSDINAPILFNVLVNPSNTTANVNWYTNENATGMVYYSTSPIVAFENLTGPLVVGAMSTAANSGLSTMQNIQLSNLFANTTYYYMVFSTDTSGNISVSVASSFRTAN